jgi:hypothetical protein
MALEGANIMGQAQVYNQTQNAVNTYMKSVAQQQAKLAAEQKALQDDLAKVKIEGIRQGDMPEFLESYNKSKEIFAKLNATRDTAEKIRLKREFDESMLNTAAIGADSRELAKGEDTAARMFMNPNIRDRYKPEAVEQFQLSKSLSRKDPRYVRDLSTLEQQIDLSKIMSDLDKIDNDLLKLEKPLMSETKGEQGGISGVYVTQQRKLSPEKQALAYSAQFDLQPSFRVAMREIFPQFAELNNTELKAAVVPELVKQRAKSIYEDEKFVRTGMTEGERRRLALAESKAAEDGNELGNVEFNKDFFGQSVKTAGGKRIKEPVKTISFDYFIKPTQKNFASTQLNNVKNLSTGRNEMMPADTNAALIGLGYTKVKGGKLQIKAVIVSGGEEYVVNQSDLPIKVINSKEYKLAKNKLDSDYQSKAGKSTSNSVKTETNRKFSQQQELAIARGLEDNPGSTRAEIIEGLGL